MINKCREIDLSSWIKVGEGGTASSFNHVSDSTIMLKLFYKGRSIQEIKEEFNQTKKIEDIGVLVPKAIEVVRVKDRLGIIYQRLNNKISYSRLCADNPEKIAEYAKQYAIETKKLHGLKIKDNDMLDCNKLLFDLIRSNMVTFKKDQQILDIFLKKYACDKVYVHGDLHTGNLLLVGNKENYWIDLGNFGIGSIYFDLGTMYLVCKVVSHMKLIQNNLHLNKEQLSAFYDAFISKYFTPEEAKEKESLIRIFALFRLLQRLVFGGKKTFALFVAKLIYGLKLGRLVKDYETSN